MKIELRITILYILIGILWILLSDELLSSKYMNSEPFSLFQSIKGTFFVLATGCLLFLLVRKERKKQDQIKQDLITARYKAEESDRLKSAFLANLSHEIRTPMNGIMGFADLLNDPDLNVETTSRYAEQVHLNSHQLLGIINNVIDISKLETNQHTMVYDEIPLKKLGEILYQEFVEMLPELSTVKLRFDPDQNTDDQEMIRTDTGKLKQVLVNLISNAIKFTREGEIIFGWKKISTKQVQFFVSDTGIGINPENLQVIFDRFRQIDSKSQVIKSGSGLGLAIARGFTELLGGDIHAESKEGQGTTMAVTIPIAGNQARH